MEEAASTDMKHRVLTVPPAPAGRQDLVSVYQMPKAGRGTVKAGVKSQMVQGNHCRRRKRKKRRKEELLLSYP